MKSEVVLDFKRIIAEVASRHGMLVSQDDPAMLLVTMNEVVLQQVFGKMEARTEEIVVSLEAGFRSAQAVHRSAAKTLDRTSGRNRRMLCVGRAIEFREEVFTDWKGLNLGRHTLP